MTSTVYRQSELQAVFVCAIALRLVVRAPATGVRLKSFLGVLPHSVKRYFVFYFSGPSSIYSFLIYAAPVIC